MELSPCALSCWSCRHVRNTGEKRLYCALHKGPVIRRCPDFDREPGADESERPK
ncbi:hypothetical protein UFOVP1165_17 [uncultured Caudovirales phage]|uniref:Uncharacterized protein n=1 Tax=uncultured Caudovirales phage TaxID=2100421 RepID=A0A6J5R8V0_9CAUD|nr:hypothetical protein UFOVP1165_17 [uncultured Caudovirales phage]